MPSPRSKRLLESWCEKGRWLIVLLVASCAAPIQRPDIGPPPSGRVDPLLIAPTTGYGAMVPAGSATVLERGYRDLVAGNAEAALAAARGLEGDPIAGAPAAVLAAQAAFQLGRCASSIEHLVAVADRFPEYLAAQLVLGRCREALGDLPGAADAYHRVAGASSLAAGRLDQIAPGAHQVAVSRARAWLAAGRVEEARGALEALRRWGLRDPESLGAVSGLAEALGDRRLALALVRELTAGGVADRTLLERRASLELAVGDAGTGLKILEDLVAQNPGDAALAGTLESARFDWRLTMLPEGARSLGSAPQLDRGQLATLLYWVFPGVRYSRPASAIIANDVLDHANRTEIVRIVNLGIMTIDPNLHAFRPQVPAARLDALRGLLRVLEQSPESRSCLGGTTVGGDLSPETTCNLAVQCGVLGEVGDCLPEAVLSGSSAMALARNAARRLESR